MFKRQLLIFLIIFARDSSCVFDTFYDTAREVQTFYSLLDEVDLHSITGPATIDEKLSNVVFRHQIQKIREQLKEMEKFMYSEIIVSVFEIFRSKITAIRSMDTMQLFIMNIDDDFRTFTDRVVKGRLEDLAKLVFPNIQSNILMIRKIMIDPKELLPNDRNLIAAITRSAMIQRNEMCRTSQLTAEILVQIFRTVMIAEIKTHVMLGFANKYQYAQNEGWDKLNSLACSQFQTYFASYVKILREYLPVVEDSYLRACDPDNGTWILNDNCFELEGTARAIMFQYQLTGCPSRTCDFTRLATSSECNAKYYEERDHCPSILTDCTELGPAETCLSNNSPRRLLYMNSTALGLLGKNFQCPSDTGYMMNAGEDPNYEYFSCSCDCYGNHNKISLLAMESSVELNRVITGLRFIRKNNILYIQIKEGLLGANGYIAETTNKWRPIPRKIDPSQIHSIDKENRIFFLDDLHLPPEYILTGIQFRKVRRGAVIGFVIELSGVPFNYTTGKLTVQNKDNLWMQMDDPGQPLLFKPINSVETKLPHKPSSQVLKYVKLKRSLLSEDLGQSTLPLFDAIPVTTYPPSALRGIGIFHKGIDGYAGFISLRLYGIKYTKFFDDFKSAHIMEDVVILN